MKTRIHVVQGDITKLAVDVIVNAANPSLMGGGGVDGAIHRAAGPALLDACLKVRQQQGDCPTGHAVITLAGDLPAKAVVHTVGPVWRGGEQNEDQLLQDAYLNSLRLVAANSYPSLMGGGGVDGAIHRAAGPALLDACLKVRQQQGDCPTGHAVITLAGDLPAKAVVHTVGPVWRGGEQNEDQLLQDAYLNSLRLVAANSYTSVAFPAISTGVYGYPRAAAAEIAVKTVSEFITRHALPEQVYFVCYDEENAHLYERLLTQQGDE